MRSLMAAILMFALSGGFGSYAPAGPLGVIHNGFMSAVGYHVTSDYVSPWDGRHIPRAAMTEIR